MIQKTSGNLFIAKTFIKKGFIYEGHIKIYKITSSIDFIEYRVRSNYFKFDIIKKLFDDVIPGSNQFINNQVTRFETLTHGFVYLRQLD